MVEDKLSGKCGMRTGHMYSLKISLHHKLFFFVHYSKLFFFFLIYLIYLFLAALVPRCSLLQRAGATPPPRCTGFPLRRPLLFRSSGSRHEGLSSCGTQSQQPCLTGPRAQAQQPWRTGPAAPRHVGSPRTRARIHVPRAGRRTLNHCATREGLYHKLFHC